MTTTQSVEEILRPLAEATVVEHQNVQGYHVEGEGQDCPTCGPPRRVPDPRFEALRCNHPRAYGHSSDGHTCCPGCGYESMENEGGIDASLGAEVRAAAACGLEVEVIQRMDDGSWKVALYHSLRLIDPRCEFGATPEEAMARTLVAAWKEEEE